MKFCRLVFYHIATVKQQMKLLNSHSSIVHSHCSIVCLITKMGKRIVEISSSSQENEIHRVDSPFNEDSKTITVFPGKALSLEEGQLEKLEKIGNNRDICMQIGRWSIWHQNRKVIQILCRALIQFLNARQNFRKKMKEASIDGRQNDPHP